MISNSIHLFLISLFFSKCSQRR